MQNNAVTIEINAEPIEINNKCAEIYRNNLLGTYGFLCFYCGQTLDTFGDENIFKHLDTHYNSEELVEEEYLEEIFLQSDEEIFPESDEAALVNFTPAAAVKNDIVEEAMEKNDNVKEAVNKNDNIESDKEIFPESDEAAQQLLDNYSPSVVVKNDNIEEIVDKNDNAEKAVDKNDNAEEAVNKNDNAEKAVNKNDNAEKAVVAAAILTTTGRSNADNQNVDIIYKCERCLKTFQEMNLLELHFQNGHSVEENQYFSETQIATASVKSVGVENFRAKSDEKQIIQNIESNQVIENEPSKGHVIVQNNEKNVMEIEPSEEHIDHQEDVQINEENVIENEPSEGHIDHQEDVQNNDIIMDNLNNSLLKSENISINESMFECNQCSQHFTHKLDLENHFEKTHSRSTELIKSPLESADFSAIKNETAENKERNVQKQMFQCNHCENKYNFKKGLKRHYQKQHHQLNDDFSEADFSKILVCNETEEESTAINKLNPHLFLQKRMFQCNHCNKRYTFKNGLKKHFLSQHPDHMPVDDFNKADFTVLTINENDKAKPSGELTTTTTTTEKLPPLQKGMFQCRHCGKKFEFKHSAHIHLKRLHPDVHPAICNQINFSIVLCNDGDDDDDESSGTDDETEFVSKPNSKEIVIKYKCNICLKAFQTIYQWTKHSKTHRNVNVVMLQCTICDELFSSGMDLKEHAAKDHPFARLSQAKYKCTICASSFVVKEAYEKHIMESHTIREYKCDQCPKVFNCEKKLVFHKVVHDPSTLKFECNVCGHKFRNKLNLQIHYRRHTGEKPYECSECPKRFIHKSQMVHHVARMHTHEKRHQCEQCGEGFYGAYYLAEHMKRHTNHKPIKCSYCDERFYNRQLQRMHERNHNEELPYVCK